jgi:hypothetical protein
MDGEQNRGNQNEQQESTHTQVIKEQPYAEQMSKTINALQKPTSFLLFILMVILVLEAIQYFEHTSRSERFTTYIQNVENSRSEEMRECGETVRDLTRRIERVKVGEQATLERAIQGGN